MEHESIILKESDERISLIDEYKKYDSSFFHPRYFSENENEQRKEIQQVSKKYYDILNNTDLQEILAGRKSLNVLSVEVITDLKELVDDYEYKHHSGLSKKYKTDDLFNAVGETTLTESQKDYISGRVTLHLYRLLQPKQYANLQYRKEFSEVALNNTVSAAFVKDWIAFVKTLRPENDYQGSKDLRSIRIEGEPVVYFWTIAPYLHDELKRLGNTASESMARIFKWVKKASETMSSDLDEAQFNHTSYHTYLPSSRFDYVLGYDERMPSHLLSRLLAKSVAEALHKEV